MGRRVFNLVSVASLLLCLGVAAIWVRGYWRASGVLWMRNDVWHAVEVDRGELRISQLESGDCLDEHDYGPQESHGEYSRFILRYTDPYHTRTDRQWAGIRWTKKAVGEHGPACVLSIPLGYVAGVLAVCPGFWLGLRGPLERRRRLRAGLCLVCGYDLRATKTRCPECGTYVSR